MVDEPAYGMPNISISPPVGQYGTTPRADGTPRGNIVLRRNIRIIDWWQI